MIISEYGKPVLKISPYHEAPKAVLEELKNSVKRYHDPTEPMALGDWEVLK